MRGQRASPHCIHGEGAWQGNPFVAAYTFTVAMHNIDIDEETSHGEA